MNKRNPYDLLGVSRNATDAEIRAAYIKRTKVLHPDRFDKSSQPTEWQMANEMLQELNEAYAQLRSHPSNQSQGSTDDDFTDDNSTDSDENANDDDEAPRATKTTKREPNAAFLKPVTPDAKLAAIVGSRPLPQTEIVSKLWDYIKRNRLQDERIKTQINADANLRALFDGRSSVTMFEMNKYISRHFKP